MTTETLNAPVCRHCGSTALASVERSVYTRSVEFVHGPDGWERDDDTWDDSDDGGESESIGVACQSCYAQEEAPDDIITTRAAYNRAHPARDWWVIVERYQGTGPTYERGPDGQPIPMPKERTKRRVRAHDRREALDLAGESGMVNDRYPWRPIHWMTSGSITDPDYWAWPVGTTRPAEHREYAVA